MKRKRVAELFLEECPNCGAPREKKESACKYCGTALTVSKLVEEDLESFCPSVTEANIRIAKENEHRDPDIYSRAYPGEKCTRELTAVRVILCFFLTVPILIGLFALSFEADSSGLAEGGGIALGFALLLAVVLGSLLCLTFFVGKQAKEADAAMASSRNYRAVIVQVRAKVMDPGNVTYRPVKVVADIDGKDTCIMLRADSASDLMCANFYPIGGEVEIAGCGKYYLFRKDVAKYNL